jgi:hypothetical protein
MDLSQDVARAAHMVLLKSAQKEMTFIKECTRWGLTFDQSQCRLNSLRCHRLKMYRMPWGWVGMWFWVWTQFNPKHPSRTLTRAVDNLEQISRLISAEKMLKEVCARAVAIALLLAELGLTGGGLITRRVIAFVNRATGAL